MAAQADSTQSLRTLFGILENLKLESSYNSIQRGLAENAALKEEVAQQRADHMSHIRSIASLQTELDSATAKSNEQTIQVQRLNEKTSKLASELEIEKAKVEQRDKQLEERVKSATELKKQLVSAQTTISGLNKKVKETQDQKRNADARLEQVTKNLQAKLSETTKALQDKTAEVNMLSEQLYSVKQYSTELTSPSNEVIKQRLKESFAAVHSFAMRFFYENLSKRVLEDSTAWEGLRDRIRWLPLLPSNSPDAKRMRVAACIGALGSMLAGLIFVPVYMDPDMGEIRNLLTDIYMTDHTREQHLRGVLLSVHPDVQQDIKRKRILHIIETISLIFGRLLDDQTRDVFKEELVQTCKVAVECWDFVRQARIKVDTMYPAFKGTEESAEQEQFTDKNWLPVPLPTSIITSTAKDSENGDSQKKGGPKLNGTAKQTGNGNVKENTTQDRTLQTASSGEQQQVAFERESIQRPVWPGFYVEDELVKGYVLLTTQVKAAREELPTRRMQRQAHRNSSVQPKAPFLC